MVKIEAEGIDFRDALQKIHQCVPWDIRIVFLRDDYGRSDRESSLGSCDIEINGSYPVEPIHRFKTSEEAIAFIAKLFKKRDEYVQGKLTERAVKS